MRGPEEVAHLCKPTAAMTLRPLFAECGGQALKPAILWAEPSVVCQTRRPIGEQAELLENPGICEGWRR